MEQYIHVSRPQVTGFVWDSFCQDLFHSPAFRQVEPNTSSKYLKPIESEHKHLDRQGTSLVTTQRVKRTESQHFLYSKLSSR